jgi:hypothetical protein
MQLRDVVLVIKLRFLISFSHSDSFGVIGLNISPDASGCIFKAPSSATPHEPTLTAN